MPELYIVAEREIADFEPHLETNGRGLSEESGRFDRVAREVGVRPLMEFFSVDPEEAAAFLEAEGGEPPDEVPEEMWFTPEEGLRTVRALSAWLTEHPRAFADTAGLIEEQNDFDAALSRLAREGVRWHLAVDF
jgi:hypothetical protein